MAEDFSPVSLKLWYPSDKKRVKAWLLSLLSKVLFFLPWARNGMRNCKRVIIRNKGNQTDVSIVLHREEGICGQQHLLEKQLGVAMTIFNAFFIYLVHDNLCLCLTIPTVLAKQNSARKMKRHLFWVLNMQNKRQMFEKGLLLLPRGNYGSQDVLLHSFCCIL